MSGWLTAGYLAFVVYITLGPVPWRTEPNEAPSGFLTPEAWLRAETWTTGSTFEILANVALFVPVGVLFRLLMRGLPWWPPLLLAIALTVGIEFLQVPLERVSDPRDLVANTAGAVTGVLVGQLMLAVSRIVRSMRRERVR